MRNNGRGLTKAGFFIALSFLCCTGDGAAQTTTDAPHLAAQYGKLPLSFEPNLGQTSAKVSYVAHGHFGTVFLASPDAVLETTQIAPGNPSIGLLPQIGGSSAVRMHLVDASSTSNGSAEEALPGRVNYFTGQDRSRWQTGVPTYGRVRFASVYPGTDLAYYGRDGELEYDFILAPHADPNLIRLRFDGAEPHLNAAGALSLSVHGAPSETFLFNHPVAYQVMENGSRQQVESSFALASNGQVTFHLGAYDASRELVIDPTLLFVGTLGTGNQQTAPSGMALDSAGEMILTGTTNDLSFPTTTGVIFPICGPVNNTNGTQRCGPGSFSSAFITKISADGKSLVFSTYLHGTTGYEAGGPITVDSNGIIYAAGTTFSNDFPITSDAFQKLCSPKGDTSTGSFPYDEVTSSCSRYQSGQYVYGSRDIYLVKLNATGTQILYGTFLGGDSDENVTGIGLDAGGNIYLSGNSASAVTTYAPGTGSSAISYPVTVSAYEQTGQVNVYLATLTKFSNDGHTLLYSTFLGTKTPGGFNSFGLALAVGQNGVAFLGGQTSAPDFPLTTGSIKSSCTTDPANPARCMGALGFATAFDTTKSGAASLLYSTFVGGNPTQSTSNVDNQVNGMVADASNNLFITGATLTPDFPTTSGVYQPTCGNCNPAAFLSKINPTGSAYLWSTFYGVPQGSGGGTQGNAIAIDSKGRINLFGFSGDQSTNLPQVNPIQTYQGGDKVFLATFTSDGAQLVFASRFGASNSNDEPITYGGLVLDSSGNVYFGGSTPNSSFPVTTGTYATTVAGSFARTFFAKTSPVLFPTTNTLTVSPLTTITGVSVTFTSVIASTFYSVVPTGTVTFMNGATTLGTGVLDAAGKAVFATSSLASGTYTVTAVYSADANYAASTSLPQTLQINVPAVPVVTLALSGTSVVLNTNVTFTATVSGTSGTPTGTVMFYDGTTLLGSSVLNGSGVATYSIATLAVGAHSITAKYIGDNVYGPLTSAAQALTVNKIATTTTLTASATTPNQGTSVTFTATVTPSGSGTPSGSVNFLDGTTTLGSGTLASGVSTFSTAALTAGAHSITAVYAGDASFATSTSTALTVTVSAGNFSLTSSPQSLTVAGGAIAQFTITGSGVGGSFTNPIALSVSGLPAGTTSSFAPAIITPGSTGANSVLSIQTPPDFVFSTQPPVPGTKNNSPWFAALLLLPLLGVRRVRRRLVRLPRITAVLLLAACYGALALTGCSGGYYGPQPHAYVLTITGQSGTTLNTTTINLTIQ